MSNTDSGTPQRVISHFTNRPPEQQSRGWSELWDLDQSHLWDRAKPSPALVDLVESSLEVLPSSRQGRRPRALVPGCGKGYDVVMLALHDFDVYGLDVSAKGVEIARQYAVTELAEPKEYNFGEKEKFSAAQPGTVKILVGDFFNRQWEVSCAQDGCEGFDLIYDYTFLCALLPEMRKDWGRRMSELLLPTGVLVCLEFPLYKDLKALGPPWGLRGVYWDILAQGGDGIIDEPGEEIEPARGSFERVFYSQPPRSYENGKGTDMIRAIDRDASRIDRGASSLGTLQLL
ncbi:hypothetical protein BFJ68_g17990 [Fusarium oxysporum]|uniref:Thiol methyltransferase 2 n=1 Tax=Fusarium oxysporum TaxID=5507 RepID=A0A420NA16_FUSOX|nr:hypothetical protein BFJ67_g17236 [Fusarium oxysporum f. sp. cepae]RKK24222.1 hypothetical protein BFJ66_g17178 [Fusarium oxysporum f. sp. cepae]RKK52208.1 hypothetical protein BFJ69_g17895 [Fusarium oxysporum]RKK77105.1 hypothetical protein BFJ68_g17990 [Fusarium oxysporum]